jgi:hypothetical protein
MSFFQQRPPYYRLRYLTVTSPDGAVTCPLDFFAIPASLGLGVKERLGAKVQLPHLKSWLLSELSRLLS